MLFIFILTISFYFLVWVINPSNYIILAAFLLLIGVLYLKSHDIRFSILVVFLISTLVLTGKTYNIQIISRGVYDLEVFPNGYMLGFALSPNLIITVFLLMIIVRDSILNSSARKKLFSIFSNKINITFVLFFVWIYISDIFGSREPALSLLFDIFVIPTFILFFYLQLYVANLKKFLFVLVALFSAFIVFESTISFQQFFAKGPIGRNIEYQKDIEYAGKAVDEIEFTYRPDGTFDHANSLGMNLTFWLSFLAAVWFKTKDKRLLFIFGIGITSLIMTLSRSAWLGLASGILSLLYILEKVKKIKLLIPQPKLFLIFGVLLIPLLIFFILPRTEKSVYSFLQDDGGGTMRLQQISATWQIILSYPIFGVGTNMLIPIGLEYLPQSVFGKVALDVHNWYLSLIANHGIPSFILFMSFVALSAKLAYKGLSVRSMGFGEITKICFATAVTIFLTIGLFSANNGVFYLMLFSGILIGEYEKTKAQN